MQLAGRHVVGCTLSGSSHVTGTRYRSQFRVARRLVKLNDLVDPLIVLSTHR